MNKEFSDESILIEKAQEDPEAFGILYQRYVDKIYSYIYYKVGNHEDAEDLTAKVFLRALSHIKNYENRGLPFFAWLHRIAHNLVANWHRDHSRRKVIPLGELPLSSREDTDPLSSLEKEERLRKVMAAVRALPPDKQEIIYLKFVERLSNQEIAIIMGKTESAIKALYHRALVALREKLQDEV